MRGEFRLALRARMKWRSRGRVGQSFGGCALGALLGGHEKYGVGRLR